MARHTKLSNYSLNEFRILVRKALMLDKSEDAMFFAIPEAAWAMVFEKNFNNDLAYATRVITQDQNTTHVQAAMLERVKRNIDNFDRAIDLIYSAVNDNRPILFVTDYDNDGSLSQSVINEFRSLFGQDVRDNIFVEYASNGKERGFTAGLIEKLTDTYGIDKKDEFLIVTADNGINSLAEQKKINKMFPNANLLITDHHNPEEGMFIRENDKTVVFNPHYFALEYAPQEVLDARRIKETNARTEAYDFFRENNISGASTIAVLLKEFVHNALDNATGQGKERYIEALRRMDRLSRFSNMVDYVETHPADKPVNIKEIDNALYLQSLLNINNSLSSLVTASVDEQNRVLDKISRSIGKDITPLRTEFHKLQALNVLAQQTLTQAIKYRETGIGGKTEMDSANGLAKYGVIDYLNGKAEPLVDLLNKNYIEQLRPFIYSYTANDNKSRFEQETLDFMVEIYEQMRSIERNISQELRGADILKVWQGRNSTIVMLDKDMQGMFNRKLINKTYNRENKGFLLTIDSVADSRIAGSFRSQYPISTILNRKTKTQLEKDFHIKLETPGHEHAAGFILQAKQADALKNPEMVLQEINKVLDARVASIRAKQKHEADEFDFITDLQSIGLVDRINKVVRGNVSHFARFTPLVRLNEMDMVVVNPKTGEQTSLSDKVKNDQYGWTSIQTELPSSSSSGKSVIISAGLMKQLSDNGFEDYLRLNYLNAGAFIGEQVISAEKVLQQIAKNTANYPVLTTVTPEAKEVTEFFAGQAKSRTKGESPIISVSREEMQDNPFFKQNPYKEKDFQKFENAIIAIMDKKGVDRYTVFDVEADGFGNANLLNIGFMAYKVDEASPFTFRIAMSEYRKQVLKNQMGASFYVERLEKLGKLIESGVLTELTANEYTALTSTNRTKCLETADGKRFFKLNLPSHRDFASHATEIHNAKFNDKHVLVNRTLAADTFAYLIKRDDVIVPSAITKLTGITNDIVRRYGVSLQTADDEISAYFDDKKTLFIAHNTEYDGRVCRVNLPKFNAVLNNPSNHVADSATFSKSQQLMYDNVEIVRFNNVPALKNLYFYNNKFSDFNVVSFIESTDEGEYPDLKNNAHIVKKRSADGSMAYFVKDMHTGEMVSADVSFDGKRLTLVHLLDEAKAQHTISAEIDEQPSLDFTGEYDPEIDKLKPAMVSSELPANYIGYKAQGLGETKLIRQMLLHNERFNIQHTPTPPSLIPHSEQLKEFQENYRFNRTIGENIAMFIDFYPSMAGKLASADFMKFVDDFVSANRHIENKYNDSWVYRSVLGAFEPNTKNDLNQTNYELVSAQTGIPKEMVASVFHHAYQFKKDYGIDRILVDEAHMNGPYKGGHVGDTAYEDKATLMLLNDRLANPYRNEVGDVAEVFVKEQDTFAFNYIKQEMLSTSSAVDTMSYAQAMRSTTDSRTVREMQQANSDLFFLSADSRVVKFKLGDSYMQEGKHLYAVVRPDVQLDMETLLADADKFKFVIGVLQSDDAVEGNKLLVDNQDRLFALRDELLSRYSYVEINESSAFLNDYIKNVRDYVEGDGTFEKVVGHRAIALPKRSNVKDGREFVSGEQLSAAAAVFEHRLVSDIVMSAPDTMKDELVQVVRYDVSPQNPDVQIVRDVLHTIGQLRVLTEEERNNMPHGAKDILDMAEDMTERLASVGVENVDIKVMASVITTAFAQNYNALHPSRVEREADRAREEMEETLEYLERLRERRNLDELTNRVFFNQATSGISRRDSAKHMMEKLDYVSYISQPVLMQSGFVPVLTVEQDKPSYKQSVAPKHKM